MDVRCEGCGYMTHHREHMGCVRAAKQHTHPAPSVPSLIEKAVSSGCFDVLPVKATIPMCKAGWGASGGELTFQQIGHIYEEMYKARPLPDDAHPAPSVPATGEPVGWPLMARVWKRESTQEWVLEIAGTLGDTDMNIRHTQPLSVAYENVPGLPTTYTHQAPSVPADVVLDCYDAGILNDFGGGNVEWWQDYIRAELGHAHDFYQSQVDAAKDAM